MDLIPPPTQVILSLIYLDLRHLIDDVTRPIHQKHQNDVLHAIGEHASNPRQNEHATERETSVEHVKGCVGCYSSGLYSNMDCAARAAHKIIGHFKAIARCR